MQRNEQEMQFADPAWQHVPHGSMGTSDLENPLVLPGNVRSSEWENEEKRLEEDGYAFSSEQGSQGQVPVIAPLHQGFTSQQGTRPRQGQQSRRWLIAIVFGIWLILFLLLGLALLVPAAGGSSSSSSPSRPPVCANQQSKCP
jgi:hypothetical protein